MSDNDTGTPTKQAILEELGLDGLPSAEQLFREIEEEILLPKGKFPEHWLSRYQMCVFPRATRLLPLMD